MYVLTIYQDAENNRAHFSSINAFTSINSPSLSFAITAADQINRNSFILFEKCSTLEYLGEHSDFVSYGVKMYSIHTKYDYRKNSFLVIKKFFILDFFKNFYSFLKRIVL